MKLFKYIIPVIVFLHSSTYVNAQTNQVKPSFIIEPYIGYITGDYENRVFSERATALNAPLSFGNRLELKFAKNFSLGLDVNYVNVKLGWHESYSTSSSTQYIDALSSIVERREKSVQKLRVMANVKAYFVQSDMLEAYAVWGFGSRFVKQTDLTTNLPIEEERFPLTFRTGVGLKYYLTNNLGIMTEIGLGGGSPVQFGLSVRL